MQFLKQSTASQIVMIGPFLEDTSGVLPQNGLTIANTDIQINKHSSATFGNKNSGGGTNVANGYYQTTLDATDTNTAGRLLVAINKTSCLPVWHEFTVLPSSSWDAIIGASGAGLPAFVHGYNTGQAPLQPTTAGRTLDVTTNGEAGIDWANIGSPTTAVNLSGTTIKTATDVETDTADIQTRIPTALVSGKMDSDATALAGSTTAATNAKNFWGGVETGTAQAGANGTITLQSNESAVDDFYLNAYITILSGTGVGQTRRITGYTGLSKVATVDTNWATNPSGDSVYQIFGRN